MKKVLLLSLLAATTLAGRAAPAAPASVPAPASQPTAESIAKLVSLEHVERIHDVILTQIDKGTEARLHQTLHGQTPTAEDQAVFASLHAQVNAAVEETLSAEKLRAVRAKIDREIYTQEEVDALVAFFSTPAGKSFIDKQPELSQKFTVGMQQAMMPMIMKIQAQAEAASQKLIAAHPAPKAAAPANGIPQIVVPPTVAPAQPKS